MESRTIFPTVVQSWQPFGHCDKLHRRRCNEAWRKCRTLWHGDLQSKQNQSQRLSSVCFPAPLSFTSCSDIRGRKEKNLEAELLSLSKTIRVIRNKDKLACKFAKFTFREFSVVLWCLLDSSRQRSLSAKTAAPVRVKKWWNPIYTSLRGRGELQITVYTFPAGCRSKQAGWVWACEGKMLNKVEKVVTHFYWLKPFWQLLWQWNITDQSGTSQYILGKKSGSDSWPVGYIQRGGRLNWIIPTS